ncbi:ankyrin repeat-containing domain protein [Aspergillus leporis]|uniref:Ankyrin repeat-containing domain protein n=1 Tax=Aspergillus leporis TaxID=41062 RepID=A0A5N5WUT9_9EURO|nr:ankyrin repeat-containing domain protein [Aspergillus leporis]
MADGFSENAGEIVFEDEPAESAATRPTNNKILDAKERKRNQNRIAQRTYRRNQKQRLRALEEALNIGLFKNADLDNTRNPSPEQDQFWVLPINDGFQASTSAPPVLDLLPSPQSAIGREETSPVFTQSNIDPSLTNDICVAPTGRCRTSLHRAVRAGNEPLTRLLLEKGADPRKHDNHGLTVLHLAVEGGHEGLVKVLLDHKIDPNMRDSLGRTALFQAIQGNNDAMATLLLEASIDVNSRDIYGEVALHLAVDRGSEQLTQILLSYGADIDA